MVDSDAIRASPSVAARRSGYLGQHGHAPPRIALRADFSAPHAPDDARRCGTCRVTGNAVADFLNTFGTTTHEAAINNAGTRVRHIRTAHGTRSLSLLTRIRSKS